MMKTVLLIFLLNASFVFSTPLPYSISVDRSQYMLEGRSFKMPVWNTGIFNQTLSNEISAGLRWPETWDKFLTLSSGLCIGAYFNGQLRLANASYSGEFVPGYVLNANGVAIPKTNDSFHLYRVTKGDNNTNPDYLNWNSMIERGAPYNDVNQNNIFDPGIDTPGMKNAFQTIFLCCTDGFTISHSAGEGFSGGTVPVYAEVRLTIWTYDLPGFEDIQFMRYTILNKNVGELNGVYFSMFFHPQIGDSLDDYVGCDTIRNLGYTYNRDNMDGTGFGNSYGEAPPAIGIKLLNKVNETYGVTSFHYIVGEQLEPAPPCEEKPVTPLDAYNLMRGYKKDNTPWLDPTAFPPKKTKYTFPGDPETGTGWTEYDGIIGNCNGATTGTITPNYSKNRIFLMSTGADNFTFGMNDITTLYYAQLIAKGSSNKNSVTELKLLSDKAQNFFNNGFVIGINPISSVIPDKYNLYQNYPNPFNPATRIKFDINKSDFASLKIFDISGKEISTMVSENLKAGSYEVQFNAESLPSGVYFYRLNTSSFSETKKMSLVK